MQALLGHEKILELLRRHATEDRPAHAYMFAGRQGVGKKKAALQFACMINCPEFDSHSQLSSCNTCRRILSNSHPDVHLEMPEKNSIRIDAIRRIISFLKYPPIETRYRVVIIDDAHLMNRSAQNALLKTLEEPPPHRLIILVTSQPSSLLSTVRSRLRRVTFGPLSEDHLRTLLSKLKDINDDERRTALAMASGSIERALSKSAQKNVEFRSRVISCIFESGPRVYQRMMELASEAGAEKSLTDDLLEVVSGILRDALVTKLETGGILINPDYSALVKKIADINSVNQLMLAYDQLLRASERLDLDINLGKNLVLDVMLLKVESIIQRTGTFEDAGV